MKGGSCDLGLCPIQYGGSFKIKKTIKKNIKKLAIKSIKSNKKNIHLKGGCNKGCSKPKLKPILTGMKIIVKT